MINIENEPLFKKQWFYEEKVFKNTIFAHLEMHKLEQSISRFNEFYELYVKNFSSINDVFNYLEKYYLFLMTYMDEMRASAVLCNEETETLLILQNALCVDCEYDKSLQKIVVEKKNPLYIIEAISNYYNLTYNVRSFYVIDGRRYYIDFDKNNFDNNNNRPIYDILNNLKSIELFPIDNTLYFQNQNIGFKLIDACVNLKNKVNLNNTNGDSSYNIAIFGNDIKNDTSIEYAKEYLEKYESIIIEKIDSFIHSKELGRTIFKNEKTQEEIYDISTSSDIASLTNKYDIILFQELPALYKENQTRKELEQTNMYLGKTDVEGQGITIKIQDVDKQNTNQEENVDPLSAEDLLVIVDYLKLAGAEAISINGQRIINMSDIVDVGSNSIIFVNQQRILAPYEIRAIGDSTKLESTLLGNGGYVEILKNYGFDIDITKGKVSIPKYSKDITHKYIQ